MALLSEEEKEQLNRVLAEYPNSEDLDLTAFIAEVIGITGVHTEEGWYNQDINDTHITFYFMSDEDIDFSEDTNENEEYYIQVDIWSKVKKWLYSGKDNRLILSDDPEYYYKVKKAVMSDTERTATRKGKFEIDFTCESYMYRVDGQDEKEIGEYLYNPYMKSQPVYKIYGNGEITLEVNGNQVTAEVTEQLNIDTKLEICYNAANEISNAALTGKYEGLYLQEGDNNFKYTEGFKVVLVPKGSDGSSSPGAELQRTNRGHL